MENLLAHLAAEIASFAFPDLLAILTLAILEGLLSVDNVLVLAILVRTLPPEQRRKALTYGIVGAFAFRFAALAAAGYLRHFTVFILLGGAYLLYLAMKHMYFPTEEQAHASDKAAARGFWGTVAAVELTDIAFSIDSITTAIAMSNKLLIIWLGGVMGIVFLRFAAGFFVKVLDRFPALEDLAYQLVFFIGIKLTLEAFHIQLPPMIFWLMMGVIAVMGVSLVYRDDRQRKARVEARHRLLAGLDAGTATVEEVLVQEGVPAEVLEHLKAKGKLEIRG